MKNKNKKLNEDMKRLISILGKGALRKFRKLKPKEKTKVASECVKLVEKCRKGLIKIADKYNLSTYQVYCATLISLIDITSDPRVTFDLLSHINKQILRRYQYDLILKEFEEEKTKGYIG